MASPDPVTAAAAYQRSLLDLLGSDDPAKVQADTPGLIRSLIADAGSRLRTRPAPKEWSVLECIGHIVDGELVSSTRYRWILAQDKPPLIGYDQDLWVDRLHHNDANVDEMLTMFEGLRRANILLWARTPVADRARIGMHSERGPESYELTFKLIAGHDRNHLAQARRALSAGAGTPA
jgi:hypothetical protein